MDLIYLDYNCFQRPFDDPANTRIQIEALACQEIFARVEQGLIQLVWSFMHDDETALCPFPDRRLETTRLAALCEKQQGPTEEIRKLAHALFKEQTLSSKDALHVAAAIESGSQYFVSCDDRLLHRAKRAQLAIQLLNPVDFIRL